MISVPLIWVVEDDREISKTLLVALASEGFYVLNAVLGEDALRMARQKLPEKCTLHPSHHLLRH